MSNHDAILAEFGLARTPSKCGIPVVTNESIASLCASQGIAFTEKFNILASGQTCAEEGMYFYDVADILRTMQTGITKLDWD